MKGRAVYKKFSKMVDSSEVERGPCVKKVKTRMNKLQCRVSKLESKLKYCKEQLEVISDENKRLDSILTHYTEKYDRLQVVVDKLVQEKRSVDVKLCVGQPYDDARDRRPAGSVGEKAGQQSIAVQPNFNPHQREEEQENGVTSKKRRTNWDVLAASQRNFAALSSFRSVQNKPQQESVPDNADTAIPRKIAGKKPVSVPPVPVTDDWRITTAEGSDQTKSKRKRERERDVALETQDTKRFDEIRKHGSVEPIASGRGKYQNATMGASVSGTAGRTKIVGSLAARESVNGKSQQASKKFKGIESASSNLRKQASSEDRGIDCLKHHRNGEDQKLKLGGADANNCGQPAVVTTAAEAAPVILSRECEMCNEKFVSENELRLHRKTCHTSKRCQQCSKHFSPPDIDEETSSVCLECSSNEVPDRMNASSEVETEIISSSLGSDCAQECFECPLCQKTYKNERRMIEHLGRHSRF